MTQHMQPPSSELAQCQETVETQARTIRLLLANYEALLRKAGHDERFKSTVEYSVGADRSFAANAQIPAGWWVVVTAGSHSISSTHGGSTHTVSYIQGEALFSNGTHRKAEAALTLAPIETKITTVEVET